MALPAAAMMLMESLYHLVDTYWVGKLGGEALASASATAFIVWLLFAFGDVAGVASSTLSAQAVGAGRNRDIPGYLRHCLAVSLTLAMMMLVAGLILRPYLFGWLGLEEQVASLACDYLLPWLFGLPVILGVMPVLAVFRGTGDARTPTLLSALMVILNALLAPLMIYGFGPIPSFGLPGVGWASVSCHAILIFLAYAILKRRGLWPSFQWPEPARESVKQFGRIFTIGAPIALNGAFFSLIYIGLTRILSRFGSEAVAAVGLGHRMESFPWFVAYGFSVATAAVSGQFIGAKRLDDAARVVWRSALMALVPIALFSVVMLLWVEVVTGFFVEDPAVIEEASRYLRIASLCWMIGLFEIVVEGGFSGAGRTIPPLVIGTVFTAIRIPLAWYLAVTMDMGALGVWISIGASMVIKGILLPGWFMLGRWKRGLDDISAETDTSSNLQAPVAD